MPPSIASASIKPETSDETLQMFRRGLFFALAKYGVTIVLGVGYWLISARMLGAEVIGTVALLTSILGLFRPLSTLGEFFALIPGLNQYAPQSHQAGALFQRVFKRATLTNVSLSFLYTGIGSLMLVYTYHQPQWVPLLWVYMIGFYVLYNMACLFNAPMMAYQQMQYSMLAELFAGLARIVGLVGGIWLWGAAVVSAVVAQVAGFAMQLLITRMNLSRVLPRIPAAIDETILKNDIREIYRFSLKSFPATASISILQHADRLILGYFTTATWLGIYTLAYSLFERILMLGTNYEDMVFASTSRLCGNNQHHQIRSLYRHALGKAFKTVLPLVVLICLFSEPLLSCFGEQFVSGRMTLIVLLSGIVFDLFARITTGLMGGMNYPGTKAAIVGAGAVANLGLNFVLVPQMGIVGAAWANTSGYAITALLCGIWLLRITRKRPDVSICNTSVSN